MKVVILTAAQWKELPNLIAKRTLEHLNTGWFLEITERGGSPYPREEAFKRLVDAADLALGEMIGEVEVIKAFGRANMDEARIGVLKTEASSELKRAVGKTEINE
jgi:hypothetical protein